MADPTGEADRSTLRLDFDRRLILQFAVLRLSPMLDCWPTVNWTMRCT
jgi:hypothetical protein